jgi:hypothetical protein
MRWPHRRGQAAFHESVVTRRTPAKLVALPLRDRAVRPTEAVAMDESRQRPRNRTLRRLRYRNRQMQQRPLQHRSTFTPTSPSRNLRSPAPPPPNTSPGRDRAVDHLLVVLESLRYAERRIARSPLSSENAGRRAPTRHNPRLGIGRTSTATRPRPAGHGRRRSRSASVRGCRPCASS